MPSSRRYAIAMVAASFMLLSSPPNINAFTSHCGQNRVMNIADLFGVFEALSACKTMNPDNNVRITMTWDEFNDLANIDGYLDQNLRYAGYADGQGPQQIMSKLCAIGECGIQVRMATNSNIASRNTDSWIPATTRGLLNIVPRGTVDNPIQTRREGPVLRYSDAATVRRDWDAALAGRGVFRNAVYQLNMDVSSMMDVLSDIFDR